MSEGNAERLANALCRMRGAALKLGQMLSIQVGAGAVAGRAGLGGWEFSKWVGAGDPCCGLAAQQLMLVVSPNNFLAALRPSSTHHPPQDENVLPPQFQAALERVRAGADVMPRRQLEKARAARGLQGRSGCPGERAGGRQAGCGLLAAPACCQA